MKTQTYMGQIILSQTVMFDKLYWWMKDGDNVIYLVPDKDGVPDFAGL